MPIIVGEVVIKRYLFILLVPLAIVSVYAADKDRPIEAPVTYETDVTFRNFPWGTSMDDVIRKMGKPVSREQINGYSSLIWQNVDVNGYTTFMLGYFSPKGGLQGGTYYFITHNQDELMRCYRELQQELRDRFGPTYLYDGIIRELRAFESAWDLPGGYVYLKVNDRIGEPVTLWYSSPELTKKVFGDTKIKPKPAAAAQSKPKPAEPKQTASKPAATQKAPAAKSKPATPKK